MDAWWSYSFSDLIMFSADTYYRLFGLYNKAYWPLQLFAALLGITIIAMMLRPRAQSTRIIHTILMFCWAWVAYSYQLQHFATVNSVAPYYAIMFFIQSALLLWFVLRPQQEPPARPCHSVQHLGFAYIVFAVFFHPLLPLLNDRPWIQAEVFGLSPDPTAVATIGVLLAQRQNKHLLFLMLIPLLWCSISTTTLWTLSSPDAWLMPIMAILWLISIIARKLKS